MEIVIIGGGPVGLFTAIKAKESNYNVTVLEKRKTPSRSQVLLLNKDTLDIFPTEIVETLFDADFAKGCYVLPPSKDSKSRCFLDKLPLASIITSVLEEELERYAVEKGVKVLRPVTHISVFKKEVTYTIGNDEKTINYDVLIGADGSNSFVRDKLLRTSFKIKKDTELYGMTLVGELMSSEYDMVLKGEKEAKNEFDEINKKPAQQAHRLFRTRNDKWYIGASLSREVYEEIKNLKKLPNKVKNYLNSVCKAAKVSCKLDKAELSFFPINVKQANKFGDMMRKIFIIGDAAQTTHFFSGMGVNVGFKQGKRLIEFIQSNFHNFKKYTRETKIDFERDLSNVIDQIILYNQKRLPKELSKIVKKARNSKTKNEKFYPN